MPTGRGYRAPRCETCGLLPDACICAELPRLTTTANVTFVVHVREWRKPTNTAKLAHLLLGEQSRVWLRGNPNIDEGRRVETELAELGERNERPGLLLYPSEDAIFLEDLIAQEGREKWASAELYVPDGTWSQSRRVVRREPSLQALPRVKLGEQTTRYHLRRGSEPGLLCTLEAVGFAVAQLDPTFDLHTYLATFQRWQHRALLRRWGKIPDWAATPRSAAEG